MTSLIHPPAIEGAFFTKYMSKLPGFGRNNRYEINPKTER
jgi:hypothetical protein